MKTHKTINWETVHSRIKSVQETIERGFQPTLEEQNKILRSRAKILAEKPEIEEVGPERIEIVEFSAAFETYGIELSYINEVYPLKEITPLPCGKPFVIGVINVRGKIFSVIDIKKFFGLPEKGMTDLNKVILVYLNDMELGILADSIVGVRSVPVREIQPSLPTLTGIRAEYLKGVTGERLVILDIEKLLSDKNVIIHEEV